MVLVASIPRQKPNALQKRIEMWERQSKGLTALTQLTKAVQRQGRIYKPSMLQHFIFFRRKSKYVYKWLKSVNECQRKFSKFKK